MTPRYRPHASALVTLLLIVAGCGVQVVDAPGPLIPCDSPCLAERAWVEYANGTPDAFDLFALSVGIDPTFGEGWMGLGYTQIEQGLISEASLRFDTAVGLDTSLVAAYAGSAYCRAALADFEGALANAQIAMEKAGPDYVFEHNAAVSTRSLHVLLADIFFRNRNYPAAHAEIAVVFPEHGLDPDAPTYLADMLEVLAFLREEI